MDLVVDANVLFSALIKDSLSYALLFNDRFHLFTPEYIFIELEKHKEEILEKTERTTEEFFRLVETLKRRVAIVKNNKKRLNNLILLEAPNELDEYNE